MHKKADGRKITAAEDARRRKVLEQGEAEGMPYAEMGRRLGLTRARVLQLRKLYDLHVPRPRFVLRFIKGTELTRFKALSPLRTSVELAAEFKCSESTVSNLRREHGLATRRKSTDVVLARIKDKCECWCPGCVKWRELGEFYLSTVTPSGYSRYCRKCTKRYNGAVAVRRKNEVARLEEALRRALCGCTALDCRVHGSHIPSEVEFAMGYAPKRS